MKKVLHITESFGGGVQTALYSYVKSSRNERFEHHLLAKVRQADDTKQQSDQNFASETRSYNSLLGFFKECRQLVKTLDPDIIHLHSSFAGFLGRFLPKKNGVKVIYTPHCYAFERQDISPAKALVFKTLEKTLLSRIDIIAGCSQRECELALKLGAKHTTLLNNYVNLDIPSYRVDMNNQTPFIITVLGRVSKQKDPEFLIDMVQNLNGDIQDRGVRIRWIGGGDAELEQRLRDTGIEVTGMLPRDEVLTQLQQAHLYIHTAAWEGMPLTILEAAKVCLPMVLRKISSTQHLEYPFLATTPQEMAIQVEHCIEQYHDIPFDYYCNVLNNQFSEEQQCNALREIYA
ncbi:glycosyltransferase [Vibrio maerlii]|uniref:glycosyltransferase n=1 Tax=Vibrio maerlii TaxID=2231648 RepID=UPI000E3E5147|nr:glycosyltransferase [Vibrio maerlii]